MSKKYQLKITDHQPIIVDDENAQNLDAINLNKGDWHILQDTKSYRAKVIQNDFLNKQYAISINGHTYQIEIHSELDMQIEQMGFSSGHAKKLNFIKAPMPGIILNIAVKEGDEIKEGDTLLILEAMKMENAITSPKDATVKSVEIAQGETVEKGKLLIELA